MILLNDIKNLLIQVQIAKKEYKLHYIKKIQNIIWDDESIQNETLNDILTDIAYDLDFYEPNNLMKNGEKKTLVIMVTSV